jgi:hypothetical protein
MELFLFCLKAILSVFCTLVVTTLSIIGTVIYHTIRITRLINKDKQSKQTEAQ